MDRVFTGLWRVWVVCSAAWEVLVVSAAVIFLVAGYDEGLNVGPFLLFVLGAALVPPILLALLLAGLAWVIAGFVDGQ